MRFATRGKNENKNKSNSSGLSLTLAFTWILATDSAGCAEQHSVVVESEIYNGPKLAIEQAISILV